MGLGPDKCARWSRVGKIQMQSDRRRRRALYWLSGLMWVVSIGLSLHAGVTESIGSRTALLLVMGATGCLTTATLFMVFVAPLERVYRHGYQAGQRAATITATGTADYMRVVNGNATVIPLRPVDRNVTRMS